MILIPPDMAEECVDIVRELANLARSNPTAKVIALTQEGINEIIELDGRIQKYAVHVESMNTQAEGA